MTIMQEVKRMAPRSRRAFNLDPFRLQNAGVTYALVVIVVILTVITSATGRPNYLSGINIANVLDQTSLDAILAVFMTVVLITGNFDLSIGSIGAFAAGIALLNVDAHGPVIAVGLALGAGLVLGSVNGFLVQIIGINAFIVTLGALTAIRGLVLIMTNGFSVQSQSTVLGNLVGPGPAINMKVVALIAGALLIAAALINVRRWRGISVLDGVLIVGGIGLAVVGFFLFSSAWTLTLQVYFLVVITVVVWAVLRFTVIGRRFYAVGGNPEAARLSGINVSHYKIAAFMLNGLAAAFVGVLYAGRFNAINPNALTGTELTVLAAAILGGTSLFGGSGSVVKSVIGALILFTLANGFNVLNLGANYQGLIQGVVIVVAAAVYTLAGRTGRRRSLLPSQAATAPTPDSGTPLEKAGKQGT